MVSTEEIKLNWKKTLYNFAKQKRAIVGLEAAIILIAFVIIAAVFSFMVVNQGLFATEQGKTVIQQGLQQAQGVKLKAAELLGISFRSFRYRLIKYGMASEDEA